MQTGKVAKHRENLTEPFFRSTSIQNALKRGQKTGENGKDSAVGRSVKGENEGTQRIHNISQEYLINSFYHTSVVATRNCKPTIFLTDRVISMREK